MTALRQIARSLAVLDDLESSSTPSDSACDCKPSNAKLGLFIEIWSDCVVKKINEFESKSRDRVGSPYELLVWRTLYSTAHRHIALSDEVLDDSESSSTAVECAF